MEPIDPSKFFLDYLLENKVITIFSQDYVFEHGTNWDEVDIQEIIMNRLAYMCYDDDRGDPDYSKRFSGVLYEIIFGNLNYYVHYKDGLRDGEEVHFYDSGKARNYRVWNHDRLEGKVFGWYENGKIMYITDWDKKTCIEFDEQGNITKQGKL